MLVIGLCGILGRASCMSRPVTPPARHTEQERGLQGPWVQLLKTLPCPFKSICGRPGWHPPPTRTLHFLSVHSHHKSHDKHYQNLTPVPAAFQEPYINELSREVELAQWPKKCLTCRKPGFDPWQCMVPKRNNHLSTELGSPLALLSIAPKSKIK